MATTAQLPTLWQRPTPWTARRGLWVVWAAANLAILLLGRLPGCAVLYMFPRARPDPRWSWKQAMCIRLWRFYFAFVPSIRLQLSAPCEPGPLSGTPEVLEAVPPAPSKLLRGVLDSDSTPVRPEARPAVWYPTKFDAQRDTDSLVVFHLFGGAYVVGGHTSAAYSKTYDKLLQALGPAKVFALGYRMASTKGNHFPAQLIDLVGAYHHLLQSGVKAKNVVLLGDSAGGNLLIALLRYLIEHPKLLPLPRAAIAVSPWVDFSIGKQSTMVYKAPADIVTDPILRWGIDAMVPPGIALTDPYLSPMSSPFGVKVPILTIAADNEGFYSSIVTFVQNMRAIKENDIELYTAKGTAHSFYTIATLMGLDAAAIETTEKISSFCRSRQVL